MRHGGELIGEAEAGQSRRGLGDRVRLPLWFDPAGLKADLAAMESSGWVDHFARQNYEGAWSILPLRAPAGARHPVLMAAANPGCVDFEDTMFLDNAPHFRALLAGLDCPLLSVRLMRLGAGSAIREHRDPELAAEDGVARLHAPVVTDPAVEFLLNRRPVAMAPGSLWYLRLSDPHSVANRSAVDRVHLVIDARVNPWLLDQLARGSTE